MKRFNLYTVVKILYFGCAAIGATFSFVGGNMMAGVYSIGAILLGFVPWIIERIIKYKLEELVKGFYLSFIFFSTFLGSGLGAYNTFEWWDIALHITSGILLGFAALYLYNFITRISGQEFYFNKWIIIFFCLSIPALFGCLWEMCEFTSDQLLGMNTQIKEYGVLDTMEDIICNTGGSVIAVIMILIGSKPNSLFHNVVYRLTRNIYKIKSKK